MIWVVVVVSLAMTLRAIEPARWSYWWDFSKLHAMLGLAATLLILAVVSTIGIVIARHGVHSDMPTWIRDLTAALAAQSSLRRLRSTERGGTLALGILPDVYAWVDHYARQRICEWAMKLPDVDLVAAAARTDDKFKGIRRPGTLEKRVAWRTDVARRLSGSGALRDESREELISLIEVGYSTYLLRKRS